MRGCRIDSFACPRVRETTWYDDISCWGERIVVGQLPLGWLASRRRLRRRRYRRRLVNGVQLWCPVFPPLLWTSVCSSWPSITLAIFYSTIRTVRWTLFLLSKVLYTIYLVSLLLYILSVSCWFYNIFIF